MTSAISPALPTATLVAIAKNESLYLTEWISYNLLMGFERIIVFDNGSTDETFELLTHLSALDPRISVIDWPSTEGISPQLSAYNHAVKLVTTDWVAFFDIDEFIVPWRDKSVPAFLATIPTDVSAMHINWRGHGSNGVISPDYLFVTETFTACSDKRWGNNYHYKTLVRRQAIAEVLIHYAQVLYGRRCLSDFLEVPEENEGVARDVVYNGIQINHYQCKTYAEFRRRMNGGRANTGLNHPDQFRDGSYRRFLELDQNSESSSEILQFLPQMQIAFTVMEEFLPTHLKSANLKSKWIEQTPLAQAGGYDVRKGPGETYFFLTHHGSLLARNDYTHELKHCGILDEPAAWSPMTIRSDLKTADLTGSRLQNYLTKQIKLPQSFPLARLLFGPGAISNTIAITGNGRFLKALPDGSVTMDASECREWECFRLLSETEMNLLRQTASHSSKIPAEDLA